MPGGPTRPGRGTSPGSMARALLDWRAVSSTEAKNFEAISKAKADHNKHSPFPPHTVRMNPFEIERMCWEGGDMNAGHPLESDPKLYTGAFRPAADAMERPELDTDKDAGIAAPDE